jgi:hypothetical protein
MALSNDAAVLLLKGLVGDEKATTAPADFYVGLSSTLPTLDEGDLTNITEPTTGGYERVEVENTDAEWDFDGRTVSNVNTISFPVVIAEYDETPSYYVVFDAETAGNALFYGEITSVFTLSVGVRLVLDEGSVMLTVEDGSGS